MFSGGFYRGSRHYWPLDRETQLRDVKYSRDGKKRGTGVAIIGNERGYLSITGDSWARLGKFTKECVCDARYCAKTGFSIGFWIKLPKYDNETKILLGSDSSVLSNTSGIAIYQTTREVNKTQERFISGVVFMGHQKWECNFPVQFESWFYLIVTWSNHSGLRMFKDGIFMSEQKRPQKHSRIFRSSDDKCTVTLSPRTVSGTTLNADYDDLVIWNYELNQTFMHQVYRNSMGKNFLDSVH